MSRGQRRRPAFDSPRAEALRYEAMGMDIPVPEGIKFETDEQWLLWKQYSAARLPADWRTFDLVQLTDLVFLECKIRDLDRRIEMEGETYLDQHGCPKLNPLVTIARQLRTSKLSLLRAFGLGAVAGAGAEANKAAPSVADQETQPHSLLAVAS